MLGHSASVIHGVIVHIMNELPVKVDLEEMPGPMDQMLRCTNVQTVDGKRPGFVHDSKSTFLFPLAIVRLIEAPATSSAMDMVTTDDYGDLPATTADDPLDFGDEEAEEDLLARIRQI